MITITEKTVGIWMIPLDKSHDWMMALEEKDDHYDCIGRIRFYNPESTNPFDEKDKKKWFRYKIKTDTREDAITICRERMAKLEALSGNKADEVIEDTPEKLTEVIMGRQWAHSKASQTERENQIN